MAYSIRDTANLVLALLKKEELFIDQKEANMLKESGEADIYGFMCKSVNVLNPKSCRVLVHTSWFSNQCPYYSKPRMKRGFNNAEIDYQLIPTKNKLLAVHYLNLRHYALLLENDRDHWFTQSYWGMQISAENETFTWSGGNTKPFPLLRIQNQSDMQNHHNIILKSLQLI